MEIKPIGIIHTAMPEKFGIPRQPGLVEMEGRVELLEPFNDPNTLRGIEEYSYIWLIWGFSENEDAGWSPTVRPPRLGGNERVGVFASRSPFRPNPIGLSCVKLLAVEPGEKGPELVVSGVDMVDGTPIYDIKPYLPYAEAHGEAEGGFAEKVEWKRLRVSFEGDAVDVLSDEDEATVAALLAEDPRPGYHKEGRIYRMRYKDYDIQFTVENGTVIVDLVRESVD